MSAGVVSIHFFVISARDVGINTILSDYLENLVSLRYPSRSKTKTNRNLLAHVFPRFVSCTHLLCVLIGSLESLWPL